jgi:hypothetical protein
MAILVKHNKVSSVPDTADTSLVRPSDWNADHTLTGFGTAAEKDAGVPNGVATLDAGGKVPVSELPAAVLGALSYQGTWNASTNTPTLTSSTGTKGYYYVVSVAGSTNLDGITDWLVGDWAVYNGTVWQKVDNTETVTSVNGQTGAVTLTTTNIAEGTNEYFTTARARASVSAGTGISYDSGTGVITNSSPSLGGDVVGPASATDNAVARYDTTTGKLIQNSLVIVDDTGSVTGVNALTAESLTVNNNATLGSSNTDTLEVNARITTDLEPNTDAAKDIGTSGRNWRDGFFSRNLQAEGKVVSPHFDALNSAGGQLRNASGTPQIQWGGGGGNNVSVDVAININPANAQVDISPTGTGTVRINPATASSMNNVVIGATTPLAGSFTDLSVTGTTSFDGSQGTSGQVLTSAGTGATPTWTTPTTGTVTSVDLTASTGISVSGGPITSSGSITVTNTAPDQTVVLTAGTGISTSGTYPNFTVTNTAPDQTVAISSGTGISVSGTYPNFTVTNTAPDVPFTYTSTYVPYGQGTTTPDQSADFTYDESVKTVTAPQVRASNGIIVNSATVSADYSIPSGSNAMSAGPITVASGITVTVPSGNAWIIV